MLPFSLYMALKYMRPKRSLVSVVTVISVLGVLLGVAILVIVLSIMTGFDDMWADKILSFNAHLTVTRPGGLIEDDEGLSKEALTIPGVTEASPHVQTIVLLRNGEAIAAPFAVGLDDNGSGIAGVVSNKIRFGRFDLGPDRMLVGWDLACQLGLAVDDSVLVYSPKCVMARDEIQLPEEFTISGIFDMGMWEFDSGFVVVSTPAARELYGIEAGAIAIRVMTDNPFRADETAKLVEERLGPAYRVLTWMEMNKTLFDALRVEKSMMFILLGTITIVAIFCVTVTLIVMGVQKTNEIGLLKAIGFSPAQLMGIFLWHGWIQCVLGTAGGLASGMLLLRFRNPIVHWLAGRLGIELFPKAIYQLSEIPARTKGDDVLLIALLVFCSCTIASILPAARAAAMDPMEALRHE